MAGAGAQESAEQVGGQHLREGCRIGLTGLNSEDLDCQRGGISGSYLADRGTLARGGGWDGQGAVLQHNQPQGTR